MEKRYYCPNCKCEIFNGNKFCSNCNKNLENGNVLYKGIVQATPTTRNVFAGICLLILAALFIGFGATFFKQSLIILGILGMVFGGLFLSMSLYKIIGICSCECPYCATNIKMSVNGKYICPKCKNYIFKKDDLVSTEFLSAPYTSVKSKSEDFQVQIIKKQFSPVIKDSSRYYQSWDENYDKKLGYEWFKICTEYIKYPDYNPLSERLANIREAQGFTQKFVANQTGISQERIYNYENELSKPSESALNTLANFYEVPKNFLAKGIGNDLISHYKLCKLYGENAFVDSLRVSILSALKMFFDLLTDEDINLCVKLDNELNLGIGFEDTIKKRKTKKYVTEKLISTLINGDIDQTSFYSSLGENRQVGINVVKELSSSGTIIKIPHGKTFILHLNKSSDFALDCKTEETEE